jgi:hypothetical protein
MFLKDVHQESEMLSLDTCMTHNVQCEGGGMSKQIPRQETDMSYNALWRMHNAVKVICNVAVVLLGSSRFQRFFRTCTYELIMDPVMLLATHRTRALVPISVHHVFVFAWALSFLGQQQQEGARQIAAIALARIAIYVGVFEKSFLTQIMTILLSCIEFSTLLISPFLSTSTHPIDRIRGVCQVTFILALGAYYQLSTLIKLARRLNDVGIILAYPPSEDGTPNLYPLRVPRWALGVPPPCSEKIFFRGIQKN